MINFALIDQIGNRTFFATKTFHNSENYLKGSTVSWLLVC